MDNNNNYIATAAVDVKVQLQPYTVIYLLLVIALGSVAFFTAKKFIK